MTQHLTYGQKKKFTPIMMEWGDDPTHCYQCTIEFTESNPREWDHLDSKEYHNYPENMGWVCHSCNVEKRMNQKMQAKAIGKLRMNIQYDTFVCERTVEDVSSSEQRNRQNKPIALQFVTEHLMIDDYMLLRDTVNGITHLCFVTNGTGSQQAVRKYIEEFCNPYNGKFTLSPNEKGETVIRRRTEN